MTLSMGGMMDHVQHGTASSKERIGGKALTADIIGLSTYSSRKLH